MISEVLPRPFRRIGGTIFSRLGDGHLAGVVRGAAFVMGIRIAGAAIALLSQIFLARWMGAFEYGIFVYVWVWVVVLGIVVPMGFGTSVLRFVPEYRTKERWRRLAGLLRASFLIVFMLGVITRSRAFRSSGRCAATSRVTMCCPSSWRFFACRALP